MFTIFINGVNRTSNLVKGSLSMQFKANAVRSASFTLFTRASDFTLTDGQDVQVMVGVTVLFGGTIKSYSIRTITPLAGDETDIEYSISSEGYGHIPSRRTVQASYSNTTAGAIVRDLLTLDLLGGEAIGEGVIDNGANVTRYQVNYKPIKEILDDMAKLSGYMWYVDNDRRLFFVQDVPVVNANYELVTGGSWTDYHDLTVSGALENYTNKVFVVGGENNQNTVVTSIVENAAEIASRQAAEGGSGVYGRVIEDSNATTTDTAYAIGVNELRKYAYSPTTITFNTYSINWVPASKLKVRLPAFGIDTDHYFLVEEVRIEKEDGNIVKVGITATRRDNNDFSTQKRDGFAEYFEEIVKKAKPSSSSTGITEYAKAENANTVNVTTTLAAVTSLSFQLEARSNILLNFSGVFDCAGATTLTARIYIGGVAQAFIPMQRATAAGDWLVSFTHLFLDVLAGGKTIEVRCQTSTGTATVAAKQGQMILQVTSSSGDPIDLTPEINSTNAVISMGNQTAALTAQVGTTATASTTHAVELPATQTVTTEIV